MRLMTFFGRSLSSSHNDNFLHDAAAAAAATAAAAIQSLLPEQTVLVVPLSVQYIFAGSELVC